MIARIRSMIFAWNWRRSAGPAAAAAVARAKARLGDAIARRDTRAQNEATRALTVARANQMRGEIAALAGGKR